MRRDALLLQGPIGPFFSRFGRGLESRGFRVWKINLNGGDRFFYRSERAVDYHGELTDWEHYLERFLINRDIGRIYLFGDCRSYHRIAQCTRGAEPTETCVRVYGCVRNAVLHRRIHKPKTVSWLQAPPTDGVHFGGAVLDSVRLS